MQLGTVELKHISKHTTILNLLFLRLDVLLNACNKTQCIYRKEKGVAAMFLV